MQSIEDLIERLGITADVDYADANPNMEREPGEPPMNHYLVTLKRETGTLPVPFSQGLGIKRRPTAVDVLDCLASDAATIENANSFEDWAGEFGYDPDSRRAERTYNAVRASTERLRDFMGDDFDSLVWDTERQ